MSDLFDLSSSRVPPGWQGNVYSLPRTRRLYYYGVAVVFALLAATLIGTSILILFSTFAAAPPANVRLLSDVHPIVRVGLSLASFLIGFLLFKYTVELCLTATRTRLLIAPQGFIYTTNGGCMWSSWNNAVRIERLFIHSGWQEGIRLRVPANVAGRTIGFSIFSIWVMPWDRFIPLTPFGTLWRMPMADQKAVEEFVQLARRLLPADSIPSATSMAGTLYHDIHHYAEHLFANE